MKAAVLKHSVLKMNVNFESEGPWWEQDGRAARVCQVLAGVRAGEKHLKKEQVPSLQGNWLP